MTKVVRVDQGNYIIQTQDGGIIRMDTGLLEINGDMTVTGTMTTINTTDLAVTDNTIFLNQGDVGHAVTPYGVTQGTAGIAINRGYVAGDVEGTKLPDAQLIWDESVTHYSPILGTDTDGTFVLQTKTGSSGELTGLQLSTVMSGPDDLIFDMNGTDNVIRIANSLGNAYESRVLGDNDIPNRKFITDYVAAGVFVPGVADVSNIHYPLTSGAPITSSAIAENHVLRFAIDTTERARITSSGLTVDNLNLFSNTLSNTTIGSDLVLTANNNNVQVDAVLNLNQQSADPIAVDNTTRIYVKGSFGITTEGPGRTGIYFVNNTPYGGLDYNNDELVSKNRAVLLSILL